MNGNLRALALSLFALLAVSAAMASPASARLEFTAEGKYPITMDGSGVAAEPSTFSTNEGEIVCKETIFTGTTTEAEKINSPATVYVAPNYKQCEVKGQAGVKVEFTPQACTYLFHVHENPGKHQFTGTGDILCPGEDGMEFDLSVMGFDVCTVTIPPQESLGTIDYENDTNGAGPTDDDVTTKMTILNELHYFVDNEFACPLEEGTYNDGSYTGNTTVIATIGGKQTGYRMRSLFT